ncbi:MAG: RHS repeat-associated core domain-containing protein, partial [Verrucomicrobiota bacterium]
MSYNEVDGSTVVTNGSGDIEQILVPEGLVNVVTVDSDTYYIELYDIADVNTSGGAPYSTTGSYQERIKVDDPDGTQTEIEFTREVTGSPSQTIGSEKISGGWINTTDNDTREEHLYWEEVPLVDQITRVSKVYDLTTTPKSLLSHSETTYEYKGWNEWEKIEEVIDPDGDNLITTRTYYEDSINDGDNYQHVATIQYPDGSWRKNTVYNTDGLLEEYLLPWKDVALASATTSNARRIEMDYSSNTLDEERSYVENTLSGKTTYSVDGNGVESIIRHDASGTSLTTLEWEDNGTDTSYVQHPDGRKVASQFLNGTWDDGTDSFTSGTGNASQAIRTTTPANSAYTNGAQGTRSVTTKNENGRVVLEEMFFSNDGSTWTRMEARKTSYDSDGYLDQVVDLENSNRVLLDENWISGELDNSIDESGITTSYTYYEDGQVHTETHAGLVTTYVYDSLGRLESESTAPSSGSGSLGSSTTYWPSGDLKSSTDENGLTSNYVYAIDGTTGGRVVTVTRPDGNTEVTVYHKDGQVKEMTGTGVVARHYTYTVNANGTITTREEAGSSGSARYTDTTVDWLGRTVEVGKPAYTGTWSSLTDYDDTTGLLSSRTATGLATTYYDYNSLGQLIRQGQDADASTTLTENSADSLTETITTYVSGTGGYFEQTVSKQWVKDGNGTEVAQSTTARQLTGMTAMTLSHEIITDIYGNDTTVTSTRSGNVVTETTDVPYSSIDIVTVTTDGRLTSQNSATVATSDSTEYRYDSLGRLWQIDDAYDHTTTITYHSDTRQIDTIAPPAGASISYSYVPAGTDGAGQVLDRTLKEGGSPLSTITYSYNARGDVTSEKGNGTYDKEFVYDPSYPEMTQLKTFRAAGGTADTTIWTYQPMTGLLTRKEYADMKGVDFTYHDSGVIHIRTNGRTQTTTYTHDTLGNLDTIDYSDSTHDLDYDFNRAGRVKQVIDAAGTHTLVYEVDGQLKSDTISGSGDLSGFTTTSDYSTTGFGLRDGFTLNDGSNDIVDIAYGYSGPASGNRLQTVTSNNHSATYGYWPKTDLVSTVSSGPGGGTAFTHTKLYNDSLLRLTEVINAAATAGTIQDYDLSAAAYDARSRITEVTRGDQADSTWTYGYNEKDEVESGVKTLSDATPIPGHDFSYQYDEIGNRTQTMISGETLSYTPNNVNQYSARDVQSDYTITGSAHASSNVFVEGKLADRSAGSADPEFWSKGINIDNSAGLVSEEIYAKAKLAGAGPSGETLVATETQDLIVPQTPESFSYDDDGNLTGDGLWIYSYNAENRLVSMESQTAVPEALRKKLEFAYDYAGRRFSKAVSIWNSGTSSYDQQSKTLFLYDGWNLVAEVDALNSNATIRTYAWGLDLSGSEQGAGGVGGLIMVHDGANTYYPGYDFNGNVTCLIQSDETVVAEYEYSPFGKLLKTKGTYAETNPFTFSTKYYDSESKLNYYGFRYYSPELGRWINRDPIENVGSDNYYSFLGNRSTNSVDFTGLLAVLPRGLEFLTAEITRDVMITRPSVQPLVYPSTTPGFCPKTW